MNTNDPGKTPTMKRNAVSKENEGEGNRTAARHYNDAVTQSAKDAEHVKTAAKKAEAALESPEGEELRQAEALGKSHRQD